MNVGIVISAPCEGSDCENAATIRTNNLYGKDSPKTEELCGEDFKSCLGEHGKGYSGFRIVSAINIKDGSEIEIPAKPPFKMTTEQTVVGHVFRPVGSDHVIMWDPYTHRMSAGIDKPGGAIRNIENPKYSTAPDAKAAKKLAEAFFTEGL